MNEVVAEEGQPSSVAQLPGLVMAVCRVDFALVVHREETPAMGAPSALVLEACAPDCAQPEGLSSSCAPGAPGAIIGTGSFAQGSLSCYRSVTVPPEALGFPHDTVSASAFWFDVCL